MTRYNAKQCAQIAKKYPKEFQAFVDGKIIQVQMPDGAWVDMADDIVWNGRNYRVKAKPRELWLNRYGDGIDGSIYSSKELADEYSDSSRKECVHFIEVFE